MYLMVSSSYPSGHTSSDNQSQTKSIWGKNSSKFQKTKPEFAVSSTINQAFTLYLQLFSWFTLPLVLWVIWDNLKYMEGYV